MSQRPYNLAGRSPLDFDNRAAARLSVKKAGGIGLAGMAGWGDGATSGVVADPSLKNLLKEEYDSTGCVKVTIVKDGLVGERINVGHIDSWSDRLDSLAKYLPNNAPVYFVLFKRDANGNGCVVVTFSPGSASPFDKMLYASTKNAVKDAVLDIASDCALEEFNTEEVSELSYANYAKKINAPKPYSKQEILRMEQDSEDTAGNYGFLARMMALEKGQPENRDVVSGDVNAKPVALPGMAGLKEGLGALKLRKIPQKEKDQNSVGVKFVGIKPPAKTPAPLSHKVGNSWINQTQKSVSSISGGSPSLPLRKNKTDSPPKEVSKAEKKKEPEKSLKEVEIADDNEQNDLI